MSRRRMVHGVGRDGGGRREFVGLTTMGLAGYLAGARDARAQEVDLGDVDLGELGEAVKAAGVTEVQVGTVRSTDIVVFRMSDLDHDEVASVIHAWDSLGAGARAVVVGPDVDMEVIRCEDIVQLNNEDS